MSRSPSRVFSQRCSSGARRAWLIFLVTAGSPPETRTMRPCAWNVFPPPMLRAGSLSAASRATTGSGASSAVAT
ncbi:hypothetical protein LUW74_00110 [Actinomadura madurae]|uniref:hypothetical protein n=1 Tax=Actinomadura madurae TaxID=1993 RepID=UPI0020271ECF|nr:hypothetical protein [Actinomadura madurae]URN01944.1 hypothetical protein LUW74_00110 [Actinomadura madurae]